MFTGLVQSVGKVTELVRRDEGVRMTFDVGELDMSDVAIGDSICISGACLTVVTMTDREFTADVSPETLSRTVLGQLTEGSGINLEKALRVSDRLGGHIVTGHVDAVGQMVKRLPDGDYERLWFEIPADLARLVAEKGSVAVDGVSLTVNGATEKHFDVALIPHTLKHTTLGHLAAGDAVNVEADILARYVVRWRQTEPKDSDLRQ
ncbi:MAG: riboflavin synthase [Pseudomonadota bacterium]